MAQRAISAGSSPVRAAARRNRPSSVVVNIRFNRGMGSVIVTWTTVWCPSRAFRCYMGTAHRDNGAALQPPPDSGSRERASLLGLARKGHSRTAALGCHPEAGTEVEEPRSGLTGERGRAATC